MPPSSVRLDDGPPGSDTWSKRLKSRKEIARAWCNAELERERGELLLLDPSDDDRQEAEAAFKQAIEIAADQGAKMLELRASAALARFWAERGERKKAFDVLAPIYGWFTQGFDTPDLSRAGTLLGELR